MPLKTKRFQYKGSIHLLGLSIYIHGSNKKYNKNNINKKNIVE